MADEVDPNKQKQVAVQSKKDWKNWALFIMGVVLALVLYYNISYAKNFTIEINGTEVIILVTAILAFLWWYFKMNQEPKLPEKHIIAREVVDWAWQNNARLHDYAACIVKRRTEKTAYVHFPREAVTYCVQAIAGDHIEVMEEGWRDIEETIYAEEKSEITKAYVKSVSSREKIEKDLAGIGMVPE